MLRRMGAAVSVEDLKEAVVSGEPLSPLSGDGKKLKLSPRVLANFLHSTSTGDGEGCLWLQEVFIDEPLDLGAQRIGVCLQFESCTFADDVTLARARVPEVRMNDCVVLGQLDAEQIEVRWNFALENCELKGGTSFVAASIGGWLSWYGSSFACLFPPGEVALTGEEMEVRKSLSADEITVRGRVRLLDAKVLGEFSMQNATLGSRRGEVAQGGALQADRLTVASAVFMDGLEARGGVMMAGARIDGDLSLDGARLLRAKGSEEAALQAEGLQVTGSCYCRAGFHAEGSVMLSEAKIGGELLMEGASLKARSDEVALLAERLQVSGALSCCEDFVSHGQICLGGADLGDLSLNGAVVKGSAKGDVYERAAIAADSLKVRGGLYCVDGFRAEGQIRLIGATVGGQFVLNEADLRASTGCEDKKGSALLGDSLKVGSGIYCTGLRCRGQLRMAAAEVRGQLVLDKAVLECKSEDHCSVFLVGSTFDELVFFPKEVQGEVDFRMAHARSYWDARDGEFVGKLPRRLRLDGFRYTSLREPLDAKRRLRWIEPSQRDRHYPGVYAELANAFRRIGHGGDARQVEIASERRARQDTRWWSPRRAWHDLLWATIGYGYRNWLAALWLVALVAVGAALFSTHEADFVATTAHPPPLNPVLYAIDVTVPILDLGQRHAWTATGALSWLALALTIAGYGLAAAVLAAAAGLLNREQG
jgi:hypothetical protein